MTKDELLLQRRRKGLTQADLATAIGYSRQAVIKWERGVHTIPADVATQIIVACQENAPASDRPTKQDKAALEAYHKMRNRPGMTHTDIIALWHKSGFTPSTTAQQMIVEAFPDILPTKEN